MNDKITWQADFEIEAAQPWPSKNIAKGDIVHFKRGIEPQHGDLVAVGNSLTPSSKAEIHPFSTVLKGVLGVCVAITRPLKKRDRTPRHRFGCPSAQTAIQALWEVGADRLDREALEWFKSFGDTAQDRCEELERLLMNVGCSIMNDENSGSFQNTMNVSNLLFHIRESVVSIGAMIELSGDAAYRLEHPEYYKKGGEQ